MNKKAATFSGWTEAVLFSALFLIVIGVAVAGFNALYEQEQDSSFGLNPEGEVDAFVTLQSSIQSGTSEGEASFAESEGLSLSTTWALLLAAWTTLGNFITGGWIEKSVVLAFGGNSIALVVGRVLRVLYLLSLGFILLKLLLKLKP
jgi:hypothetical protein